MGDPTVNIKGKSFDAADALAALDEFKEKDDRRHGVGVAGNVAVYGDGYPDTDICIAPADEVTAEHIAADSATDSIVAGSGTYHGPAALRSKVEDALGVGFVDYLTDEVFTFGWYTIEPNAEFGDARVAEYDDGSGFITTNDLNRAVEDDNVELAAVKDGWLHVEDQRHVEDKR